MYSDMIGTIGGFLAPDGTEIHLGTEDIGEPIPVDDASDVQGHFFTGIDLPGIPIGTTYGWSSEDMCWYYFTPGQTFRCDWVK